MIGHDQGMLDSAFDSRGNDSQVEDSLGSAAGEGDSQIVACCKRARTCATADFAGASSKSGSGSGSGSDSDSGPGIVAAGI